MNWTRRAATTKRHPRRHPHRPRPTRPRPTPPEAAMLPLRNTAGQWGWVSVTLHWVTVLAIVGLVIVGMTMDELPNGPDKIRIYALHKSTGLTVLALTLLRLGWRLFAG